MALALSFTVAFVGGAGAQSSISLGTSGNYSVLGGSTVTNTGSSVLSGDLGLSPGTSVTGFPPGTVGGSQNVANAAAVTAKKDLVTAYDQASGEGPISPISAATLGGGQTLTPGIYNSTSTIDLTGSLTLNGGGNQDAVFIFQAGSALNAAGSSKIVLSNGAQAGCVFWQVTSSATIGTGASFAGTVLALTSITADTGASIAGRLLARNGAVTLDNNRITVPAACAAAATTSSSATTTTAAATTTTTKSSATTTTTKSSATTTTVKSSGSSTTTTVPKATPGSTIPTPAKVTG